MQITTTGRTIEKELFVAVSPERAFRAFTRKEELERWFVIDAELDLRVGGRWRFRWTRDVATGTFVEIDPPRLVVMEWDETPPLTNTLVTVTFDPEADGTRIRLLNSGFGTGDDWDALYDGVNSGWGTGLADLKQWLETGAENGSFRIS